MPGFNIQSFPYMLGQGEDGIYLIDVKQKKTWLISKIKVGQRQQIGVMDMYFQK